VLVHERVSYFSGFYAPSCFAIFFIRRYLFMSTAEVAFVWIALLAELSLFYW